MPPKAQKTVPPLACSTTNSKPTCNNDLIDLDKSSVRVSILEEFDPILSGSESNYSFRTISPEYPGKTLLEAHIQGD